MHFEKNVNVSKLHRRLRNVAVDIEMWRALNVQTGTIHNGDPRKAYKYIAQKIICLMSMKRTRKL